MRDANIKMSQATVVAVWNYGGPRGFRAALNNSRNSHSHRARD